MVAHVVFTTLGFGGLITVNAWLLALTRQGSAAAAGGVTMWRRLVRIFGPLLALGLLAGFVLALLMGISLAAWWLVAVYALILIVMGAQGAIMVPWQIRAQAAIARGEVLPTRPIAIVLSVFVIAYIGIIAMMTLKP